MPVEDFARPPQISHLKLSPDGQYVAFLRQVDERYTVMFADLANTKFARIDPGEFNDGLNQIPREITSFRWISDKRIIFTTAVWDHLVTGVSAVDRDGERSKSLTGVDADPRHPLFAIQTIRSFKEGDTNLLMLDQNDSSGADMLYPNVIKVDTVYGFYETVVKNPGNIVAWGVDRTGCVRLGVTETDKLETDFIYRENEKAAWHALPKPKGVLDHIRPSGFDAANQKLYVAALFVSKGRWAIYPFDPATGALGSAVMEDPDYDIAPEESLIPAIDGIALDQPIFSDRKPGLVGVYYLTEGPRMRWFDPEYAAYQHVINKALPNTVNLITSPTRDEKRMLVFAFSDKDPGTYYLFDTTDCTLVRIGSLMGWIKPELMASMHPIKYKARDGQVIHGYLTLPPGRPRKHLPLIVMPHGGPWVRDVWRFDPLVQMLANRGYDVLQMNYRGSPGYGEDFYRQARHEIGRGIQDDIEDGTRWAIDQGFADPKHIAIVGASYGGYSALFALGHNPDLYRCGISIAGVTDWFALIKSKSSNDEGKYAREYWNQQIGDPKNDGEFLKSISPVNFADKITAPVLIIQGKEDRTVPPKQARMMISALNKAGHPPESLFVADEGHGFTGEKALLAEYKAIDAFLAKNL